MDAGGGDGDADLALTRTRVGDLLVAEVVGGTEGVEANGVHGEDGKVSSELEVKGREMELELAIGQVAERAGALVPAGAVRGLGHENESIVGVRFIGDLAYVVTFLQTDPLYVIDLSDPTRPRLAGELRRRACADQKAR